MRGSKKANASVNRAPRTPISAPNPSCRVQKGELLHGNLVCCVENLYTHRVVQWLQIHATDFSLDACSFYNRRNMLKKWLQAPTCGPIWKSHLGAWRSVDYEWPLPYVGAPFSLDAQLTHRQTLSSKLLAPGAALRTSESDSLGSA